MNKNELKRMLSQVDEKHVAEILDTEETTSSVTVIRRRSTFGKWTAIAAAVCLCVVGGGVVLGRMQGQTPFAGDPNSQVEELLEYDLIRESIPKELCVIDYTWEAGGENFKCSSPMLPFADSNFNEVRSTFFCDENGNAVNFYAHLKNDEKSVQLTISDRGHLFPNNFFVDLSGDADRRNPAIHIYDMTQNADKPNYELYYLYNDVGMSMETSGYTEKEAVALAAALLKDNTTAEKLHVNSFDGYKLVWETVPERQHYSPNCDVTGDAVNHENPALPFDTARFDTRHASFGFDTNDEPVYAFFGLADGQYTTVTVRIDDRGKIYNENFAVDLSADAALDFPVIHIYDCSWADGDITCESYELFCRYQGVGITIVASDCSSDEVINMAAALLKDNATVAKLYADTMNSETKQEEPSNKSEYFRLGIQTLPMIWGEIDNVKMIYQLEDCAPFLDLSKYEFSGVADVYCIGGDTPNHAVIYQSSKSGKSIELCLSQEADMFGDMPFPENGGVDYRSITLYGARAAAMGTLNVLSFIMNDTGFTARFDNLTDDEIFEIIDVLIDNSFSLQSIPLGENVTHYPTLEELQTDERFGFAAPQSKTYGDLQLHEDRTIITAQRNTETDSPERIHTLFCQYVTKGYQCFINFNVNNVLVSDDMQPSPVSADSITEESVLRDGLPGADGFYTYDYIIPVGEFYFTVNGHCKSEEMWLFLKDILRK